MARIDSLLAIVVQQGANELRVGTHREPKMLAHGAVKRLSMPETNEETLRELLGDILTPAREQSMRERGRCDATYETESGNVFSVSLTTRGDGGFDATFLRASARPAAAAAPRAAAPPLTTPSVVLPAAQAAVAEPAPSWSSTLADSELVSRALATRGSDLHLVDGDVPMLRVDGKLVRLDDAPTPDVLQLLGLDQAAAAALARGASIELSVALEGEVRARVHVYRTASGNAAAIRFLGRTPGSLASLNLPVPLDDLVEIPHGLVIFCGATGSGKSTTLAALAQEALRRRSVVLISLEDPIEYVLSAGESSIVRQRQVGRDVPDVTAGLRDALREDPDILIVGEMRDPETIALALTAAETGHLVIATLHSGSAASAIERIVDSYGPERQAQIRNQIADSLRVVVAQRLLPRARGSGRIPALEVLRVNHAAASMIREGKTAQLSSVIQSGRRDGMISLERCLADRVLAGEIRPEHARAAANDAGALAMLLTK
ncbi:MAG TPA: PilT/PilU family type 4a pilus ATPase [Labilithrix sp.]|nr:PilT/PilU family type 4a pilus ATPase [Labilithrix sp.]